MAGIYIDCSSREIILIIRPKMRLIVTRVLVRSVCLSVCCTQSKTLQNHGTARPVVWDMGSVGTVTRCLHFTAGCATGCTNGWVNYATEPRQAALERSSQDAYDVIS